MKNFFKENKIFVILMGIVVVCMGIILSLLLVYFYQGGNKDPYGSRLDDIKSVAITKEMTLDIASEMEKDAAVEKLSIEVYGRIVYLNFTIKSKTKLEEAEGKATIAIAKFSEDIQKLYDFQINLKENAEEGFVISGAKNMANTTIIWNNNTPKETE